MVRQRAGYGKSMGKLARYYRQNNDSDSGSDSEGASDDNQEEEAVEEEDDEQEDFGPTAGRESEGEDDEPPGADAFDSEEDDDGGGEGEVEEEDDRGGGAAEEEPEAEEEEEEDEPQPEPDSKKRKAMSAFMDDSDEDEQAEEEEAAEEEEEEEDEEEEEEERGGRGAQAKRARNSLFDEEAEVDDDEEDEDEGEEIGDLITEEDEAAQAAEAQTQMHARVNNLVNGDGMEQNDEELERFIAERYGGASRRDEYTDFDEVEGTEVEQQAMLPTVKDPKLWMVRVRPGKERETCVQLMQKSIVKEQEGKPMHINSAVAHDHLKGYIYIESEKQSAVKDAIQGLRNIFSFRGVKLVPITEMTEVMTVKANAKTTLKKDSYVHIRNGVYKGDLAQVLSVNYADYSAEVKLVPRIDLNRIRQKLEGEAAGKGKKQTPPQRLFSKQEAKEAGLAPHLSSQRNRNSISGNYYDSLDGMKFEKGYLIKNVSIGSCQLEEAPAFDELQRFHMGNSDEAEDRGGGVAAELALVSKQAKNKSAEAKFQAGDSVVVIEGDLKNLEGTVNHINADGEVYIMPKLKELNDLLKFKPSELDKHFKQGDHVKVMTGRHEGDTGMIVGVNDGIATIFTDLTKEEVKCFTRDLMECTEQASGQLTFGQYELHDLVALDPTTVGVIVTVEKEACAVLTNHGSMDRPDVRTCRLHDIKRKIVSRHASTQDTQMNSIQATDIVKIVDGPGKDKVATVLHVHRERLFAMCRDLTENGGVICLRGRSTLVHGASQRATNRPDQGKQGGMFLPSSPAHQRFGMSPRREGGGLGGKGGYSGSTAGPRRDEGLINSMVQIVKGPWRSYIGKVMDATDTTIRLELDASIKFVTVPRHFIKSKTASAAVTPRGKGEGGKGGKGGFGGYGNETPSRGGHQYPQTPMREYGSMTPMRGEGSSTPMRSESVWNPRSRMTPMHESNWGNPDTPSFGGTPGSGPGSSRYQGGGGWDDGGSTPGGYPGSSGTTPRGYYSPYHGSGYDTGDGSGTPNTHQDYSEPYGGPSPRSDVNPMSPARSAGGDMDLDPPSGGGTSWLVPGLVVKVEGRQGVVRSVGSDGTCRLELGEVDNDRLERVTGEQMTVDAADLQPVPPVKGDNIRVIDGGDVGLEAQLIGVDGDEGVLKVKDGSNDMKVLSRKYLGRMFFS